jgi:ethanolamine ammonia-lyase small subunit
MTVATPSVTLASWESLRRFTDARIALGRAGHSMPTGAHLAFQLAHAQARDAVHLPMDSGGVSSALQAQGLQTLLLRSAALDRASYLRRPDWGRRLDAASQRQLLDWRAAASMTKPFDVAFVIADGLSALAVQGQAAPLIACVLPRLAADESHPWTVAPIALVQQGRVAVGDEVAQRLGAQLVVVLIGERPGLSAPDSLGIYITWAPQIGTSDALRNCISNVRPGGLSLSAASDKLCQILLQARSRRVTGVALKDEAEALTVPTSRASAAFFLGADGA